ncbi:MAG: YcxB family protein [Lachnospiraceae bacterium]|nr:YcxB family protein [Lachnospiraceae bacterium]
MIELDVKIEAKDLYDYMLRHSYNSPAGVVGSCFGALMIVFAAMTGQWLYLVFGLIILLYLPWTLFIRSKQQILSNPSFQQPLHYMLDEQGITISQGEESVQYLWTEMVKAVSTGRSIIVYTSKINATIFPKKQMGDMSAAVIEMISTHMPPAKVKIRG